jgi:hypothetical protein
MMNNYDLDSLSLVARERRDQRLREADTERLAHLLRIRDAQRRGMRVPLNFVASASQRLRPRRLET